MSRTKALLLASVVGVGGWAVGYNETANIFASHPNLVRWDIAPAADGRRTDITWALAPGLCDESNGLTLRVPEETVVQHGLLEMPQLFGCAGLKRAVRKAMRAWEAANSNIHFFDVSSACADAWTANVSSGECHGAALPGGVCLRCPLAELVIAGYAPTVSGEVSSVQIRTSSTRPMVPAADYAPGQWQFLRIGDSNPELCRTPGRCEWHGGFPLRASAPGRTIVSAALLLSQADDQCYWSDSDICTPLFEMQVRTKRDIVLPRRRSMSMRS